MFSFNHKKDIQYEYSNPPLDETRMNYERELCENCYYFVKEYMLAAPNVSFKIPC